MFGNHGLGGLPEEGAHEKSPKCLGGNWGIWGNFAKVSNGKSVGNTRIPIKSFFKQLVLFVFNIFLETFAKIVC